MKKKITFCLAAVMLILAGSVFGNHEPGNTSSASKNLVHEKYTKDFPKAGVALSDLVYRKPLHMEKCCLSLTNEDIDILLQIAAAEAGTEDITGKALVMRVVLNRTEGEEFPDTVKEVVFQHDNNRYQFCPVKNGSYQSAEVTQDCWKALDMVLSGWNESQGATYFCTPDAAHKWHEDNLHFLFQYGGHRFYKEKGECEEK